MLVDDCIRDALQEILEQDASQPLDGNETLTGIRYLNRMVQSWPVDLSYTVVNSVDDVVTVPAYAEHAVVLNLAVALAPQFDYQVMQGCTFYDNALDAYKKMLVQAQTLTAPVNGANVPLGSGNKSPGNYIGDFYTDPA